MYLFYVFLIGFCLYVEQVIYRLFFCQGKPLFCRMFAFQIFSVVHMGPFKGICGLLKGLIGLIRDVFHFSEIVRNIKHLFLTFSGVPGRFRELAGIVPTYPGTSPTPRRRITEFSYVSFFIGL